MSLENYPDLLLNISDTEVKPEEIHSYLFKSFTLKPDERQLFDRDTRIALTPKAFDVLTLLIVNAGHLVTKEELLETIWAESFVEEANLARLVHATSFRPRLRLLQALEGLPARGHRRRSLLPGRSARTSRSGPADRSPTHFRSRRVAGRTKGGVRSGLHVAADPRAVATEASSSLKR